MRRSWLLQVCQGIPGTSDNVVDLNVRSNKAMHEAMLACRSHELALNIAILATASMKGGKKTLADGNVSVTVQVAVKSSSIILKMLKST